MGYIDLSLRIRDDGGPTYAALASIGDVYARGDRVRQLLYLGLMVERVVIRTGVPPVAHLAEPAPAAPREQHRRDTFPVAATTPNDTLFDVDDLTAIFGSHQSAQAQGA